jgi:2-oxo-3-hexenedioate decarboxylase
MIALARLAEQVDTAALNRAAIPQLTQAHPKLSVADSYAIQALSVGRRTARGEWRIGYKMGLTSRAKMNQVGVNEVIFGRLTNAMLLEEGGSVSKSRFIHPRIEPEIAFLLGRPLSGNVSPAEAMAAVEAVAPAMELIDSRYVHFKFTLPDVIADNSSSSAFVVGHWHSPLTDIANLGMVMSVNGRMNQIGSSAAILGHPVRSLVAAARMIGKSGEQLNAGDIVMAGGATEAHSLAVGDVVKSEVENLGAVQIKFEA